jgi:threonyl-tRNA synthetase
MRILLMHSDFIEYEVKKKAIATAEEITKSHERIEDCLVVFTSAEDGDTLDVVQPTIDNIKDVAQQVKADRIVIYPFVHLSSKPASPSIALSIVKGIEEGMKNDFEIHRAPFGWYKEFTVKCKGHPLSELSREIKAGEAKKDESEALKKESQLKSEFFIIEPTGAEHRVEIKDGRVAGFDFTNHEKLRKLAQYEMAKNRVVDKEPPHVKLMKQLDLVDYEPGSDPGNLRYMPKGRLIKSLLEEFVTSETIKYGAMEVETPIMYDYEHPSLKNYLNRFPARQYTIQTPNKRVFLRFAACFGQFLMAHDANISYRNLPLPMYELTRYSFRVEQRGEIAGLRRLRTFTMPDCHALCKDIPQAKDEMAKRFELARTVIEGSGLSIKDDLEFALRVTKDFYDEHKDFVHMFIRKWGRPAFVEIWDKKFFYFIFKYEWNFIDALDKAATLTTDQIDVENAERYDIRFVDADNKKKFPVVLHLSPSGAIERVMYALLEKAAMKEAAGKNPMFPLWLTPTQVRLCPINDTLTPFAENVAEEMSKHNIRVDIDDRTESVQKKIRDAEKEWVPLIVVLGEKERESGQLAVRFRKEDGPSEVKNLSMKEMIEFVHHQTKSFPYKQLSMPRLMTKRPLFS